MRTFVVPHNRRCFSATVISIRSRWFLAILPLFVSLALHAGTNMTPVVVTGFNRDMVIEASASGPPYTAAAQEFNPGEGTAFYQSGLPGTAYGLPVSGLFTSVLDGSTIFQFQPYTTNNALVMSSDTGISTGTLTLAAPTMFDSIAILANSGGGGGAPNVTLQFSDGSSVTTTFNASDWFNNAGFALQGMDRINLSTGATDGGPSNPRFYQTTINIAAFLGATNKPLSHLVFNQAAGAGATAIWAISGSPPTNMTPVAVIGFNRDVMVESNAAGPPYTAAASEVNPGEGNALYEAGLPGKSAGLPASGSFVSALDGSTVFQLQSFTASNALVLSSETGLTSGTLTLSAPATYNSISVIAHSANAQSTNTGMLTIHFNDGSSFQTNYNAFDWFGNAGFALQGFGRVNVTNGAVTGPPNDPRFYQTSYNLASLLGATNKPVSSLTFGKAAGANATAIYAVSGALASPPTNSYTLAVLTNTAATGVTVSAASLGGQVLSTGNDAPVVTIFYGTTNGGTSAAAWANSVSLGVQAGVFTQAVSGLFPHTAYYFTSRAVNAGGTSWAAPALTFTTLSPTPPVVTNLPASGVMANSASLNGEVLSTGGAAPSVTIFYGTSNGGTTPGAWQNSIALGLQGGAFGKGIFDLSSSTTYYFNCRAVNEAGTVWGTPLQLTTLVSNPPPVPVAVLTHHDDNGRTGRNLNETVLNISNVNTNDFGLIGVRAVDDQIYAQPLVMTNVSIPGKGAHDIVYACTVNDSVYAFDADNMSVSNAYWQVSFLGNSGGTNVVAPRNTDMTGACGGQYMDFSGAFGIVGTPVIDPVAGTMFLVARTKEITATSTNYVQRLHALDITTGAERANSPVIIAATFPGSAPDGSGGVVTFSPYMQNQRAGLALVDGIIYIAWTSHCDWSPYHGWVMAYDSVSLLQRAVYNDTANGSQGGIWMSGQAPAADTNGNIYLTTANGDADTTGTANRSQSFLKLSLSGTNLTVASWFTPFNYGNLNDGDLDLGSGGVLLIPGTSLLFSGGKGGVIYLVNKDNMGGLGATADTNIVQSFPVTTDELHGGPVWWDGPDGSYAYVWPASVYLQQYRFDPDAGLFELPIYAQDPTIAAQGEPGGILAISANGSNAGSGIVWAYVQLVGDANQVVRPGILHAYDAQNVTNELWNSEQLSVRDRVGNFAKFVPPTVANGKVYIATFSGQLNVYGLLPPSPPVIVQQVPASSAILYAGDELNLSVSVVGTAPLFYQWYFNSTNVISGATGATFTVTNLQFANTGTYDCVVSNGLGAATSTNITLTVIPAPTVPYAQLVLSDGPIAYYRLDETNGFVAHDYLGGYNGVYTNVALGEPGYNSLDPDTAAGFGIVTPTNSFVGGIGIDFANSGAATFSAEAWVKGGAQTGGAAIVCKGTGAGGEEFALDTGSGGGKFRLYVRDLTGTAHNVNGTIAPDGNWHHLVGVCDEVNGYAALYVDGVSNATTTITGGVQSSPYPLTIGSRQSGTGPFDLNFAGTIDEVALYNYALSAAQVTNHYFMGTNAFPVMLTLQTLGNQIKLTWPGGTLQAASQITGIFTNVPGASSPYMFTPSNSMQFFRVKVR